MRFAELTPEDEAIAARVWRTFSAQWAAGEDEVTDALVMSAAVRRAAEQRRDLRTVKFPELHAACARAFGPEWTQLCDWQRVMIADDFRDAVIHGPPEGLGASEYRDSIGAGNLTSYALALGAQWRAKGYEPGQIFSE